MIAAGFDLLPGEHPIIPVMLHDASLASRFAARMMEHSIYVTGFSYPVVPMGKARVRTQISAAHTKLHLEEAISAFTQIGQQLGCLGKHS